MFSLYFLQLYQCSLMPVKVKDSCAHMVQHLRDMTELCKDEGRMQVNVAIATSGPSR